MQILSVITTHLGVSSVLLLQAWHNELRSASSFSRKSFFRGAHFGALFFSMFCFFRSPFPHLLFFFFCILGEMLHFKHVFIFLRSYFNWMSLSLPFSFVFRCIRPHKKIIHRFNVYNSCYTQGCTPHRFLPENDFHYTHQLVNIICWYLPLQFCLTNSQLSQRPFSPVCRQLPKGLLINPYR